ncbi:uncharacterized protein STEHIDRAFT_163517 [Stereum hirsutum FP-91666 SS1]|uniref:Uncharacterized protein n=1 Tax=Stereum hirsutum (strain FP-91666) TaxID=721885 RepID=R7RXS5_STEHR|nr:uncharacterized protein STEHIDRAFT_163517 [Stereum hirsutum FP-91666 SS1]EIM79695.1 hypothetical protein STEHIDRAFT_163517 [Stereum hirsutum FP-91666 SS1]
MDPNLPATDGFFGLSFLNADNMLDTGDIVNIEEPTAPTDNQEFNYWYPEAHPQIDEPLFRNPADVQRVLDDRPAEDRTPVPNQQSTSNASPELALAEMASYINWDGTRPAPKTSSTVFKFGEDEYRNFTFPNPPSSGGKREFTGSFPTHFNQRPETR